MLDKINIPYYGTEEVKNYFDQIAVDKTLWIVNVDSDTITATVNDSVIEFDTVTKITIVPAPGHPARLVQKVEEVKEEPEAVKVEVCDEASCAEV
ncbi:MAG: hypothetical protein KA802_17630 [Saprospiraceae bacterium]|nr:hypothetical protein [Saprospiraceae bacterium]